MRLAYPDYRIVVCDNCSSDGPLEHIHRWVGGEAMVEYKSSLLASLFCRDSVVFHKEGG
jgi:hypothetical protein